MMARSRLSAACSFLAASSIVVACNSGQPEAPADPLPYLDDASYRRSDLVASLVNPANSYSTLRLAHYATGNQDDWDLLPEWNPPAEPIAVTELDADGGAAPAALSNAAVPLTLPTSVQSADDPALLALGAQAFARYPAQLAPYFDAALASRAAATSYGLWLDDARGVGGLVRARMADGSVAVALTCSTCHAAPGADGALAPGLPAHDLNIGAAILDAPGSTLDPMTASAIAAWGPGRLDVTTTTGTEPARIPDLRPVQWLTYLQQDATVRVVDRTTLAIRIETLLITSSDEVVRPPRVIALALASYVASLGAGLPLPSVAAGISPRGAAVFAAQCTGCHVPPDLTGAPVSLSVIGTDPTLGLSAARGTGTYRVPSLHGVGSRGPLLHDGTVPSVESMFDPTRTTPSFPARLHGLGAVPGHTYGLDLSSDDRTALVDYLNAL
jgi:cytochrome c5